MTFSPWPLTRRRFAEKEPRPGTWAAERLKATHRRPGEIFDLSTAFPFRPTLGPPPSATGGPGPREET